MSQHDHESAVTDAIEKAFDQLSDREWNLFLTEVLSYISEMKKAREDLSEG